MNVITLTVILGSMRLTMNDGMPTITNKMNKMKPWLRRLFHPLCKGMDQIASVRKVFRPPTRKKSTRHPIMNPMNKPIAINTTKRTAQTRPRTRKRAENKIPWRKYLSGVFHRGSVSVSISVFLHLTFPLVMDKFITFAVKWWKQFRFFVHLFNPKVS